MTTASSSNSSLLKTIAVVRVATSVLFLLFGEYKIAGPGFAHEGFPQYLREYINGSAVSFYRPVLEHVFLPHAIFFGYTVGAVEFAIGVALLLGLWVRPASVVGFLFLLNLLLSTWWAPGHGVPVWRYFGSELDTIPLMLLFMIFYAADAGRVWGLDGR